MPFIGIDNSTEYFSHNYLTALLEKRYQAVQFKSVSKTAVRKLKKIHKAYFTIQSALTESGT